MSFVKIDKIDDVDCFVFNTCHIREKATQKVYSDIGKIKKYIEINLNQYSYLLDVLLRRKHQLFLKKVITLISL